MTFSIVARDLETGDLGVAVASKFLAVGAVVPHAEAGNGAIATQAFANVRYGPDGLALLRDGTAADEVLERLTGADDGRSRRQIGIVDSAGRAATYTGSGTIAWAGGRIAEGVAAQGNLLTGPAVVDALIETYLGGRDPFPSRLLQALAAADKAGGDRRGRQSAALLIVREGGGYGGANDRWMDLRVDDHTDPVGDLVRLVQANDLLRNRSSADEWLPIDEHMAADLRHHLEIAGYTPQSTSGGTGLADLLKFGAERAGESRATPPNWDTGWDRALSEWMAVENLEARVTAPGWIDPRVLDFLHTRTDVVGK